MPTFSYSELTCAVSSVVVLGIGGIILLAFAQSNKEKTERRTTAIILFVFLILCCISFWVIDERSKPQSPRWEPAIQDIVGTYYPINTSLELLKEIEYKIIPAEYSMTFNADGTFSAINLPDIIWNPNHVQHKYGMAGGTWKLENDTISGEWDIELHIVSIDGTNIDTYSNVDILGKKPPFIVYIPLGELDWLMYKKRSYQLESTPWKRKLDIACPRLVGVCDTYGKQFSGFEFFLLPSRVHARALSTNGNR